MICPFMSMPLYDPALQRPVLCEVRCKRELCAAWGPVEPHHQINACHECPARQSDDNYITLVDNEWRAVPYVGELVTCGCRRLGGEVRQ